MCEKYETSLGDRIARKQDVAVKHLGKDRTERANIMGVHSKGLESFGSMDWLPQELKDLQPQHMTGDAAGASPMLYTMRNGALHLGEDAFPYAGLPTMLAAHDGKVVVFGFGMDAKNSSEKDSTRQDWTRIARLLSARLPPD